MKEVGGGAGGNTSILKMLQISTVFPRNHKHAFCLPAGLPPPHYTELLDRPHCSPGQRAASVGVGLCDPAGEGVPLRPGRAARRLPRQSRAVVQTRPRHPAPLWAPTVADRHCQGVESWWLPASCRAVCGGGGTPANPRVLLGVWQQLLFC